MRGDRLIGLLASVLSAALVAASPAQAEDPALTLLNATSAGAFRQGWSGEGEDRIHYVAGGSGPTVVFVHGFPSFWYAWRHQLQAFAPCRRVIAIDAPGANLSGRPGVREAYRVARLAERLDAFIAEVAPGEKITLVGHDWGGALAWSYAEWRPQRVARLAAFSAPPFDLFLELAATDPAQRERSAYMQRFRALDLEAIIARRVDSALWTAAYAEMVARGVLTAQEGALFRSALSPSAVDAGMDWYRANVPPFETIDLDRDSWPARDAKAELSVLLVEGERDRTFVPELAARARAHADTLQTVTLPGVGHWTPFEDPAAANAALGRFLGLPEGRCPAAE